MKSQKRLLTLLASVFLTAGLAAAVTPPRPIPRWKVKVLIYTKLDVRFVEADGPHHVTAEMTPEEIARDIDSSKKFFEYDVPLLSSGLSKPVLTIVVKTDPLTSLTPAYGYWPFPGDVGADFSNQFDSTVIIWKGEGWDWETKSPRTLGWYGGLAWPMGTGPGFIGIAQVMVNLNHRNVFKHEWGHTILSYYDAAGTAPRPTVSNHFEADTYAHCGSGALYAYVDEDDSNPIPNSIYNNYSGFHHDFYSGTTALPSQPNACLGITPAAWASGGPVTRPRVNPGDVNGDQVVDDRDLWIVMRTLPAGVGPNDPRDLDYDGRVTISDARLLVLYCTKPNCAQ